MRIELNRLTLFSGHFGSQYVLSLARQWRTRPGQGVFRNWRFNGVVFLPHFGAGVPYASLETLTETVAQVVSGTPYQPVILSSDFPAVIYTLNNMMLRHSVRGHKEMRGEVSLDPTHVAAYICKGPTSSAITRLKVKEAFLSEADLLPGIDAFQAKLNRIMQLQVEWGVRE